IRTGERRWDEARRRLLATARDAVDDEIPVNRERKRAADASVIQRRMHRVEGEIARFGARRAPEFSWALARVSFALRDRHCHCDIDLAGAKRAFFGVAIVKRDEVDGIELDRSCGMITRIFFNHDSLMRTPFG